MNFCISKPTKVIEIRCLLSDKTELSYKAELDCVRPLSSSTEILKTQKSFNSSSSLSLDFYNIENDNFNVPGVKTKNLKNSEIGKNTEIEEIFNKWRNEGIKENSQLSSYSSFSSPSSSFTPLNSSFPSPNNSFSPVTRSFLISSLKNDLRIKNYRENKNCCFTVFFYTVEDSISFYKQFYCFSEMSFKNENELVFDTPVTMKMVDLSEIYPFKKFTLCTSSDSETDPLQEFESRVNYFNRMKNMFSKNELKKISNLIEEEEYEYVFMNIKELCVGSSSNVVIQEMLKQVNGSDLCKMIRAIGTDISAISATKYGAYTVQTLIMACQTKEAQELLVENFGVQGRFLICHEIGNYSIQRILLFGEEYVFGLFKENLAEISQNTLGIKVFKRCLELLKGKTIEFQVELEKLKPNLKSEVLKELEGIIGM